MCHTYMYGLGGAEKGDTLKTVGFLSSFEGVKMGTRDLEPAAAERAGPVGRCMGEKFISTTSWTLPQPGRRYRNQPLSKRI